jgi:hypothetical protein
MRSSSRSTERAGKLALALLAALLAASPARALPPRLPPIDQCSSDASFVKFRKALEQAAARHDRVAFLAMLSPDVVVNFGGASGRDAFASEWSFDPSEYGNVWDLLETMLKMGCARSGGSRVIPSLLIQLEPFADEDLFDRRLLLPGARLFKEPGQQGSASETVPWSVARAINTGGDLWTGVRLVDGRDGWISDDELYEPLGYRMTIDKRKGKWIITAFVAGD